MGFIFSAGVLPNTAPLLAASACRGANAAPPAIGRPRRSYKLMSKVTPQRIAITCPFIIEGEARVSPLLLTSLVKIAQPNL
jgi:hypothetical protein